MINFIVNAILGKSDHDRLVQQANSLTRKWTVIKADNAVEVNYTNQGHPCVAHENEPVWHGSMWKSRGDSFYIGNIANADPLTWEIRR